MLDCESEGCDRGNKSERATNLTGGEGGGEGSLSLAMRGAIVFASCIPEDRSDPFRHNSDTSTITGMSAISLRPMSVPHEQDIHFGGPKCSAP